MDEAFILQAVGRLYLENESLRRTLQTMSNKDTEIAALQKELTSAHNLIQALKADERHREE